MAFSCLSPALLLLGIRGEGLDRLPDGLFFGACIAASVAGMAWPIIYLRIQENKKSDATLEVGSITPNPDHPFVYAIAVILPIWAGNTDDWRNALATFVAFLMVWLLFAISDLHHSNLILRLFGYQIYTVTPPEKAGSLGAAPYVVLSRDHLTSATEMIHVRTLDSKLVVHVLDASQTPKI